MVSVTWITPFAPDHDGGGGQIRQAHLLGALAARAEITLICPGPVNDPDVRAALSRLVEVAPLPEDWRGRHQLLRRVADLAASVTARPPIEVRAFRPVRGRLGPAVASLAPATPARPAAPATSATRATSVTSAAPVDLVLVEYLGLAPLLPGWHTGTGRPAGAPAWVLTLHNLPSRMANQQAQLMAHRRQRWLLTRDAKAGAAFERRAAEAFDAVITCTDEDAAALAGYGRVQVVPNGTDTERFRATPLPSGRRIVFTGALYTTPNVDGAQWFCRQVLPLIRQEEPAAQVDLVGSRPSGEVRALAALPGVALHADVASVVPYLEAARVAVVPIRVGSGTRLKALEAMAAGRPVVGTTIGLEGLRLELGKEVLVADDPAAFADAVVRLLRDDDLAARLAAGGRLAAERRYAWPPIAAAFADAVIALAGQPKPTITKQKPDTHDLFALSNPAEPPEPTIAKQKPDTHDLFVLSNPAQPAEPAQDAEDAQPAQDAEPVEPSDPAPGAAS